MSETMTELKPCPFCGARAELVEVGINSYVRCPTCHANSDDMSADRAIEKWNARSPAPTDVGDDLVERLDRLVSLNEPSKGGPYQMQATHRHKKRGTEYVLIGIGKMQAEYWRTATQLGFEVDWVPVDMREVAIYRSATDPTEIWVRPREEFEDGRFEALRP